MKVDSGTRLLITSAIVLGIGLGGFIDGISLHQLLQTHNMMSAVRPKDSIVNLEINMFWDGLFHLMCWVITLSGVVLLFRAARRGHAVWSGKLLGGGMLLGWGTFNFVEGLIDHYLLGIHHVVERVGLSVWDHLFLISGILFAVVGLGVIRRELQRRSVVVQGAP